MVAVRLTAALRLLRQDMAARHPHQGAIKTNLRLAGLELAAVIRLLARIRLQAGTRRRRGRIVQRRLEVGMGRDMIRVLGWELGYLGLEVGVGHRLGLGREARTGNWG